MTHRFTCGWRKTWLNIKKSQNIMKILVDLILVNYELDTPLSKRKIKKVIRLIKDESLHKKWSFPLRISSVSCGFGHLYWRNH